MSLVLSYTDNNNKNRTLAIGGGTQSVTENTSSGTITHNYNSYIQSFRTVFRKFVAEVPLVGEDSSSGVPNLIWDEGGIIIEHTFSFVEVFNDSVALNLRMSEITKFLSDIPVVGSLKLEFDELGWSGSNSKSVVVKSYDINYEVGSNILIRGTITVSEGRAIG